MSPKKNRKSAVAKKEPVPEKLYLALLAVLVLVVYSPCLHAGYLHWDDFNHYTSNPCVYSLSWYNLCNIFRQAVNETYIPLTTLSFNLEYHLFGINPFVSHLINVLLHLTIVLMVYDLGRSLKLSAWPSFIAGAIFAVHPMHVESVAWVTERKDMLSIVFYLACLKQYWLYVNAGDHRRYGSSLAFSFLSILSKPMAVSIPWVLLLLDWYLQRPWSKKLLLEKLPFAVLIFPIACITVFHLSPHPQVQEKSLLIGLWTFAWYLEKFVFPVNLTPAYSPALPLTITNFSYAFSAVVFVLFIAAMFFGRRNRLFIFACLFWIATNFFFWRFDFADNNIVADRFMYLPSLGFCLLLGTYLSRPKLIAGCVILVLGTMSFVQCHIWKNDTALWTWTLTHDLKNGIAKGNWEEAVYSTGETNNDYLQLTRAIDQNPTKGQNYLDRGIALQEDGDYILAFEDFNRAVRLDPSNSMAYTMRGQLYALRGEPQGLDDLNKAIALDPHNALAYIQKASIFEEMHQLNAALELFNRAVEVNPLFGPGLYQRGIFYDRLGQYGKSIDDFSKSIALKSNLKESYTQRAEVYQELKEFPEAENDFKMALKQNPADINAFNELGIAYLMQGDDQGALEVFNKVIAMHPFYDKAYVNRGIVDIHQRQFQAALLDYTHAINLELYPYHALITRGDIYLLMGERDKALADYKLAMFYSQGDGLARLKRDRLLQ